MKPLMWLGGLALLAALSACTEQPQARAERTGGVPAYMGISGPYTAGDWKPGDATSWEEKMRTRTQSGQNEYLRSGGK